MKVFLVFLLALQWAGVEVFGYKQFNREEILAALPEQGEFRMMPNLQPEAQQLLKMLTTGAG